ncbi:MAG: MerR family transcriptional regulator [Firmicutes bacterium]|nr:MerR family transcriptional regulator [Bacillota bacterium]
MTYEEISENYGIPREILREYERRSAGKCKYDDGDIKKLGILMTLRSIGFEKDEEEEYIRLILDGDDTAEQRMSMLIKKRNETLEDIHVLEKCIDSIDYLRYELRKEKEL